MITFEDVKAAHARIAGSIPRTPTVYSDSLSRALGTDIWLKLDNQLPIGAYKERGAANRLALLTDAERKAGVVAMSAGNHAQAVARHASLLGIGATIVMPRFTPATKITRTASWGAEVVLHGDTLPEAADHAFALAHEHGYTFVHPYDDPAVMAGGGTVAIEMLEDAPEIDTLIIPYGGGGLVSGCAVAAAASRPGIEVIGVEVEAYSAGSQRRAGKPISVGGPTIAEGIAVRDIGVQTWAVIERMVSDLVVVNEEQTERAIAMLLENAKTVAEGAGAVGVAAVLAHPERFKGRKIGTVISGGNIDSRVLSNVLQRNLLRDGRILKLTLEIPDRPGVLADITARVASVGANIIEVIHQRLFHSPSVQDARLDLVIEARDAAHGRAVVEALEAGRYVIQR